MMRFRPHALPLQSLPLNVRSAGHRRLEPRQAEGRVPGEFLQVFWSVAGDGTCRADGREQAVRPGGVFLYHAGEEHLLTAGADGWEYRWLTFDGRDFRRVAGLFDLPRIRTAGPCPERLFERLDVCLRDATAAGEHEASVIAYELLLLAARPEAWGQPAEVARRGPSRGDVAATAKACLDARFADPRLNIAVAAGQLRVHRASLHRAFLRAYGVAPVRYLAGLRLRRALELLGGTTLPVTEVAARVGLTDAAYLSRLVSRATGHSPRVYRERHGRTGA